MARQFPRPMGWPKSMFFILVLNFTIFMFLIDTIFMTWQLDRKYLWKCLYYPQPEVIPPKHTHIWSCFSPSLHTVVSQGHELKAWSPSVALLGGGKPLGGSGVTEDGSLKGTLVFMRSAVCCTHAFLHDACFILTHCSRQSYHTPKETFLPWGW